MKRPIPTVLTMKSVLDRHLRPIGLVLTIAPQSNAEVGERGKSREIHNGLRERNLRCTVYNPLGFDVDVTR